MKAWTGSRPVIVVSACMTKDGLPTFVLNEVAVTQEEYENGQHYTLAEECLAAAGYEEPCVHFDEREAPSFLIAAVADAMAVPHLIIDPDQE